jgi:PAS domain S-box-containing protein
MGSRATGSSHERLAVLEAFAEASVDALLSHDLEGRITAWNRSAERIFGYREGEILGQDILALFPSHLRAAVRIVYDTALAGDRIDHVETEIQRPDGMPVPVSLSVLPVVDGDARVVGAVSVAHDLTEQRLAQASLAEVEARRRGGEAQAHVGRWLWDIGTGAVQWSDELHRIHGIDPLEFAGTLDAHLACVHDDDRARVRATMDTAADSGRHFEEEYRIVRPGGEVRWLYLRADPTVSSAGQVVGLRGIGQDVTDEQPVTRAPRGS